MGKATYTVTVTNNSNGVSVDYETASVMLVTNLALPMLCYAFYQRLTR